MESACFTHSKFLTARDHARVFRTTLARMIVVIAVLGHASVQLRAGSPFLDTFDDGKITDGSPMTWSRYLPPFDQGEIVLSNGDLTLIPSTQVAPLGGDYHELDLIVEDQSYHDVTVETVVRATNEDSRVAAGVTVLDTAITKIEGSFSFLGAILSDGTIGFNFVNGAEIIEWGRFTTDLDLAARDVRLKLVVDGENAHLTAWNDGEQEPLPQLVRTLPDELADPGYSGRIGIFAGAWGSMPEPMVFRSVHVVPEPGSGGWLVAGLLLMGVRRPTKVGRSQS